MCKPYCPDCDDYVIVDSNACDCDEWDGKYYWCEGKHCHLEILNQRLYEAETKRRHKEMMRVAYPVMFLFAAFVITKMVNKMLY